MCLDRDSPERTAIISGPTLRRVEDQHSHNAFAVGNILSRYGQLVSMPGRPAGNSENEKQQTWQEFPVESESERMILLLSRAAA
jgi:hypothetical protein